MFKPEELFMNTNQEYRKIIHIDMDAFYASVEQRDNPDLRGKPLAVGGDGQRGVVAAASYEARKYGVRSAMSSRMAVQKCPELIFVRPRFDVYRSVSLQIRQIFYEYTPLVEPLSLDEAFLDVTHPLRGKNSATLIANEIRKRIMEEVSLTSSAGVSFNKFLAKTASDINKPNGFFVIKPEESDRFIDELPVNKFFGVGRVTAEKFHKLGVHKGSDVKRVGKEFLIRHFGKNGLYFHHIANGLDKREVEPDRIRKSVGAENTFSDDLLTTEQIIPEMDKLTDTVFSRLQKADMWGKTLTVKIKYHDFTQITRSKTFQNVITNKSEIGDFSKSILFDNRDPNKPIRLLGISFSHLEDSKRLSGRQLKIEF